MPPPDQAKDRGAKAQSPEPDSPALDYEDGVEIGNIDWWKMAAREFIRSSVNMEGDVQAKAEIFEYLADRTTSLRSLMLVVFP